MTGKRGSVRKAAEKRISDKYTLLSEDSDEGIKHRIEVFEELLEHLRRGYSLDSFGMASRDTILLMLKTHAAEWPEKDLWNAVRKGQELWESLGYKQAAGLSMGNASAWKFAMSAKYGWTDKIEVNANHSGNVDVTIVDYAKHKTSSDSVEA